MTGRAKMIVMLGIAPMQWAYQFLWAALPSVGARFFQRGGFMKAAKQRKTRITIETQRVWVLEKPRSPQVWCPSCGKLVSSVTPDEVAALATGAAGPHCPIKIDKLHFIGTSDGLMVVCGDSLLMQGAAS